MNNKIAFICPTHLPHFDFVKSLFASFRANGLDDQSDLWFVFSNVDECNMFGSYPHKLTLPAEFCINENGGLVNIKKFWAIRELRNSYEYIITIDSESLFVRPINLYKLCRLYFSSKILLGNKVLIEGSVLTEVVKNRCKEFFPVNKQHLLTSALYLWFNQPCIYKTSNLEKFFAITQLNEKIKYIDWHQFDYYVYMYFLIIYEKFSIIDMEIEANYGVCEATSEPLVIESEKYKELKIMISSLFNFKRFNNPYLFQLIQIDR